MRGAVERRKRHSLIGDGERVERHGAVGVGTDADVRRGAGYLERPGRGKRKKPRVAREGPAVAKGDADVLPVYQNADRTRKIPAHRNGRPVGNAHDVLAPVRLKDVGAVRNVEPEAPFRVRRRFRYPARSLDVERDGDVRLQPRNSDAPLGLAVLADALRQVVGSGIDGKDIVRGATSDEVEAVDF